MYIFFFFLYNYFFWYTSNASTYFKMSNSNENNELDIDDRLKSMEHLVCKDEKEIMKVNEIIEEASNVLYNFSIKQDDYYKYSTIDEDSHLYFKKVNNTDVGKIDLLFQDPSKVDL